MWHLYNWLGRAANRSLWFIFRVSPQPLPRVRIAVICEGQILLVKPWFSRQVWSLPGGGAKLHESLTIAAMRELNEETGISVSAGELHDAGVVMSDEGYAKFRVHCFVAYISASKARQLRTTDAELIATAWHPLRALPHDRVHFIDYIIEDTLAARATAPYTVQR